eukprot:GFUD01023664.1.p1 GENE.GFUD01023664.1~~GFUD01023664.1.p1  ORF type:complete len:151 (-),score=32.19 GFUD01023664.1:217-648(-)
MFRSAFLLFFMLGFASTCIIIVIVIPKPETTTKAITTSTTATTTMAAITTTAAMTTTAASGRKKRSTGCSELEALENLAFTYCPHVNVTGFKWQEVVDCEANFVNVPLSFVMPTEADFNMVDGNGTADGMMTMDEWKNYVGCA